MLLSEDENIHRCGARLLYSINDLSALPVALDYLACAGEMERSDMTYALWKFRNQRSVLEVALSHGSHVPRAAVVRVVAFSNSMSVIDLLERAAADTHPKVRLEVMERIKLLRDRHSESPKVVAIVNIGLIDSDSHVRRATALA